MQLFILQLSLDFHMQERDFYKALEGKHQQRFLHLARNVGNNYANILVHFSAVMQHTAADQM